MLLLLLDITGDRQLMIPESVKSKNSRLSFLSLLSKIDSRSLLFILSRTTPIETSVLRKMRSSGLRRKVARRSVPACE